MQIMNKVMTTEFNIRINKTKNTILVDSCNEMIALQITLFNKSIDTNTLEIKKR